VAGHVLPVQLRLRGGRGLSTALGAMLVLDPAPPLIALGVAAAVAAASRHLTAAGLAAAVAAPVAALLLGAAGLEVAGMAATALLVVAAHARRAGS
jgi:glycerol-3-phosphate acyltransferase PlsY